MTVCDDAMSASAHFFSIDDQKFGSVAIISLFSVHFNPLPDRRVVVCSLMIIYLPLEQQNLMLKRPFAVLACFSFTFLSSMETGLIYLRFLFCFNQFRWSQEDTTNSSTSSSSSSSLTDTFWYAEFYRFSKQITGLKRMKSN